MYRKTVDTLQILTEDQYYPFAGIHYDMQDYATLCSKLEMGSVWSFSLIAATILSKAPLFLSNNASR
jgi:hypothetical protein